MKLSILGLLLVLGIGFIAIGVHEESFVTTISGAILLGIYVGISEGGKR